jgi:glycosyltransferase involved in cell wall biosynthesis
MIMKCAYFVRPHIGGTYSVFSRLCSSLKPYGVELRWLAAGAAGEIISFPEVGQGLSDALRKGDAIDQMGVLDEQTRAKRMITFLRENNFKVVFVNVLSSRFETNLVRYLPDDILRIMIVHNITPGTYAAAREIRDYVHATVGVSKRCRDDLVNHYGFDPQKVLVIPHGLNKDIHVKRIVDSQDQTTALRLLYLGRIEDNSKGVFWLPSILRELKCDFHLTVAGDGPDLLQLRHRLEGFGDKVTFTSWVAPSDIPWLVSQNDVLIMPSRFEGFGLTLIEAMSQGCPAVVSKIAGVTDLIVTHGEDGFLFPVGDTKQAACHIDRLASDSNLRIAMAQAAVQKVAVAFNNERVGSAYAELIKNLASAPPVIASPLRLSQWKMPTALHSSLRSRLPQPVKNWLREMRERLNAVWSTV